MNPAQAHTPADPCAAERTRVDKSKALEASLMEELRLIDLSPQQRRRLEAMLARTRTQQAVAQRDLDRCKQKHHLPH
jgi:hypothetical protein